MWSLKYMRWLLEKIIIIRQNGVISNIQVVDQTFLKFMIFQHLFETTLRTEKKKKKKETTLRNIVDLFFIS